MTWMCVCGQRATALHHVVYQQHVRRHGGDLSARSNFLPLCARCHERHHNRTGVLALSSVPEPAWEFARELLGDYAPDYLARRYAT